MKKSIITISGHIASGKSELADRIKTLTGMSIYKASDAFREMARVYKMSLVEFNEYIKDKPKFDELVEEYTKTFADENDFVIIDARLGFYVVPDSFKVYLNTNIEVAARRLYNICEERGIEERYTSVADAKEAIILREAAEQNRYKKTYNVDMSDYSNYDIVVDTTEKSLDEVAKFVIDEFNKWRKD